jgi:uncharacterized protein YgiM (DUF1202 family)
MIRLILLLLALLAVGFVLMGREPPEGSTARLTAPVSDDSAQAPATVEEPEVLPEGEDGVRPVNPNAQAAPDDAILPITQPRVIADEGRSAPLNLPPSPETAAIGAEAAPPARPLNDGQVQADPPARGQDGLTEGVPADPALAPAGTAWFVAADKVNLRAGQGIDFAVLGAAYQGEPLTLLSDPVGEWVQVRTQDGIEAFVKTEFLTQSGPLQ